ncbi:MAG: UDP-N-acetylmuramoyl-L-alanyl-D-glutamate--2,6-diaminopimelate ligase [Oscillospiraceae bacterium]|nr:UDP-N-acetylmuramoyl-L-alanyl-D-glutamate--2,6-diaminopimelate ligase [Oscillospiraceae bacterium]
MHYSEIIKTLGIEQSNIKGDPEISGVVSDNRKVMPGYAFVCLKGAVFDGHDFASEAIRAGASVIISEKPLANDIPYAVVPDTRAALPKCLSVFYGAPEKSFKYSVGITGTNGKTSTSYMLKHIFEAAGFKTGLIGTMKYLIGDREFECDKSGSFLTTPDPELLFKILATMRDEGVNVLIMEVSSHSLELEKIAGLSFTTGIFTNLTRDHLDFHKTMENYRHAKEKLFTMCEYGLFNNDDPAAADMMKAAPCECITYGINGNEADFTAKNIRFKGAHGVEYELLSKGLIFRMKLPIPGLFTVYNSLAAVSCALNLGISPDIISNALENMDNVCGRIDRIKTDTDFSVFIDFAHTPDALENVLKTIRGFAEQRIITLFGCGGDRDKTKRPIMGKIACDMSDYVIITSDNSRSESKESIISDILAGITDTNTPYKTITSRIEAIHYAIDIAEAGDVILLAGKGHEEYEIDSTGKHPFSERNVVLDYLKLKR